jgi:hypothetical protein
MEESLTPPALAIIFATIDRHLASIRHAGAPACGAVMLYVPPSLAATGRTKWKCKSRHRLHHHGYRLEMLTLALHALVAGLSAAIVAGSLVMR